MTYVDPTSHKGLTTDSDIQILRLLIDPLYIRLVGSVTWYDDRLAISLFCRKIMMRSVSQVLLSWDQGVINKLSALRFQSESFLHFCEQHIHHRDQGNFVYEVVEQ